MLIPLAHMGILCEHMQRLHRYIRDQYLILLSVILFSACMYDYIWVVSMGGVVYVGVEVRSTKSS